MTNKLETVLAKIREACPELMEEIEVPTEETGMAYGVIKHEPRLEHLLIFANADQDIAIYAFYSQKNKIDKEIVFVFR